ncbi:hypothetical protein MuYL_1027 [Mucilaginibacter xinganensis]|uniref:Uncharacterized protein n=1 Tax=Mucilaginibacter xinganensis TaxID=1234841 RepID=A0A223NSV6_9SPHI|nr:hypothetical protein MuYL_1027 [Mucilaginibacter xinganensis]
MIINELKLKKRLIYLEIINSLTSKYPKFNKHFPRVNFLKTSVLFWGIKTPKKLKCNIYITNTESTIFRKIITKTGLFL